VGGNPGFVFSSVLFSGGYAGVAAFIFVLLLMAALIFVSIIYTEKIERRISNLLKGKRPSPNTNISS